MQDEQNIPLLQDVVAPDDIEYAKEQESTVAEEITNQQRALDDIREEVAIQLIEELQPAILASINSAVDQATGEIRKVLLDELQGTLQNRLRLLIDEALHKQPSK